MLSAAVRDRLAGTGAKAAVLAHRDELTAQNRLKFTRVAPGVSTSVVDAGEKSWAGQVAKGLERFHPPLATDQHEVLRRPLATPRHGDGLLETERLDRGDNLAEDLLVTLARVEDLDPFDRDVADLVALAHRLRHAALRMLARSDMR
jgi:hypothetical protein